MNKIIVFYENIINPKKEISISAYYPSNISVLDLELNRINLNNLESNIRFFEYEELDKRKVFHNSIEDVIFNLKNTIGDLQNYELNFYSKSLREFLANNKKNSNPLDKYNYLALNTNADFPQLNYISKEFHKHLKFKMSQY